MRSSTKTTGIFLSAVLVSSAVGAPAIAAQGRSNNGRQVSADCQNGGMRAQGRHRAGQGEPKSVKKLNTKKSGTLTDQQKADLAAMAEEEKLAHDVYVTLATSYPDAVQFARIPTAETRHLAAVQGMLAKYGLADPTDGMGVGEFKTTATQALFDELVAQATTKQAALEVGVAIEKQDIVDLKVAKVGLKAPDVRFVYNRLLHGSSNHLRAFQG